MIVKYNINLALFWYHCSQLFKWLTSHEKVKLVVAEKEKKKKN